MDAAAAGDVVYFPKGTFIIGDSGSTIPYRVSADVSKIGIALPDDVAIEGQGFNSVVKVKNSSDAVPFTARGKSRIAISNLRIDGNEAQQTGTTAAASRDDMAFGIYLLNCDDVQLSDLWIEDTVSNTLEIMGCTDVLVGNTYHSTSQVLSLIHI